MLKNHRGFTLAETLMTILILLMASAIVGAAIPAAANAYQKSVDAANAQVVLSTTITRLRDQLSTAGNTKVNGTAITYKSGKSGESGTACLMMLNSPTIIVYKGPYSALHSETLSDYMINDTVTCYDLLSKEAVTGNLVISYTGISKSGHTIIFENLVVKKGENNLTEPRNVSIRVLS
jgi:prepilin-type N-terminal cleavage/methylation domain-containing protein